MASDELFGAWRTFFEKVAATGPVVLVFQDLHWADPGTLDFIDHLVEWSRGAPILILSLARPELLSRRPNWGAGQRGFTSLYLEPLPEAPMRGLLDGLVADLPDATCEAIVARSEGIPFYAIETIRMLVATGELTTDPEGDGKYRPSGDLQEVAVPETLTALVAARLDALEPGDRALLLDAAVLGHSFTPAALAAVSGLPMDELDARLRSLVQRELLATVADARSPERGQHAFVQALVREVTYHTLSKKDRKARHLAAARWFESLDEAELAGALAGHYLAARENAAEGPESDALGTQARIALKGAADRAAALGAHRQALSFLEQAIAVATDPAEIAELHRRAGESAAIVAEYDSGEAHFLEALTYFRAAGDRSAAAGLISALGSLLITGRRLDRAAAILEPAAEEFADLVDDPSRLVLLSQLARAHFFIGNLERSVELADQVIVDAERSDNLLVLADTLVTKGSVLANLNRRHEGLALIDAGGRIAEANGFTNVTFRAINNALSNRTEEFPRAAYDSAAAGLALARRLGQAGWVHSFAGNFAYVSQRVGEWDAGITELRGALADATDPLDRLLSLNNLINLLTLRGEPCVSELEELEAGVAMEPTPANQIYTLECAAWIAWTAGRIREARDLHRQMAALDPSAGYAYGHAARIDIWLDDVTSATADRDRFWAARAMAVRSGPAASGSMRASRHSAATARRRASASARRCDSSATCACRSTRSSWRSTWPTPWARPIRWPPRRLSPPGRSSRASDPSRSSTSSSRRSRPARRPGCGTAGPSVQARRGCRVRGGSAGLAGESRSVGRARPSRRRLARSTARLAARDPRAGPGPRPRGRSGG